jgi:hypothetical protein
VQAFLSTVFARISVESPPGHPPIRRGAGGDGLPCAARGTKGLPAGKDRILLTEVKLLSYKALPAWAAVFPDEMHKDLLTFQTDV